MKISREGICTLRKSQQLETKGKSSLYAIAHEESYCPEVMGDCPGGFWSISNILLRSCGHLCECVYLDVSGENGLTRNDLRDFCCLCAAEKPLHTCGICKKRAEREW